MHYANVPGMPTPKRILPQLVGPLLIFSFHPGPFPLHVSTSLTLSLWGSGHLHQSWTWGKVLLCPTLGTVGTGRLHSGIWGEREAKLPTKNVKRFSCKLALNISALVPGQDGSRSVSLENLILFRFMVALSHCLSLSLMLSHAFAPLRPFSQCLHLFSDFQAPPSCPSAKELHVPKVPGLALIVGLISPWISIPELHSPSTYT